MILHGDINYYDHISRENGTCDQWLLLECGGQHPWPHSHAGSVYTGCYNRRFHTALVCPLFWFVLKIIGDLRVVRGGKEHGTLWKQHSKLCGTESSQRDYISLGLKMWLRSTLVLPFRTSDCSGPTIEHQIRSQEYTL